MLVYWWQNSSRLVKNSWRILVWIPIIRTFFTLGRSLPNFHATHSGWSRIWRKLKDDSKRFSIVDETYFLVSASFAFKNTSQKCPCGTVLCCVSYNSFKRMARNKKDKVLITAVFSMTYSNTYLAHRIQQPIPKLRILNFHEFFIPIRFFLMKRQ